MPDEKGNQPNEEGTDSSLHAYKEGREEDIEGKLNDTGEPDADQVENTGGATSGGPGGAADGEEDPSEVEHEPNVDK